MNEHCEKKIKKLKPDESRPEYNFSKLKTGVRGKYAGTNLVLLSPDVAKHFPDERSVNAALRTLIRTTNRQRRGSH